ncbi:MAG: gliding motility-associated C-terminal domain-containing protein, partial [Bacteroidales bacterium]|nr:gliding motility-associated C-terminal domain-containing protein [Bacteroidales bacterium]
DYNPLSINPEDRLTCVICDNGTPSECVTAVFTIQYELDILFTEAISPNGDGINDLWLIPGIENYAENNVKIFNRWGSIIYEIDNYDNVINVWDGTRNYGLIQNGYVSKGTYFYVVEIKGHKKGLAGRIEVN